MNNVKELFEGREDVADMYPELLHPGSVQPVIEDTDIELSHFIEELNVDLALEYSAAIQYLQHATVISDMYANLKTLEHSSELPKPNFNFYKD